MNKLTNDQLHDLDISYGELCYLITMLKQDSDTMENNDNCFNWYMNQLKPIKNTIQSILNSNQKD